jgi:hypothetical protein
MLSLINKRRWISECLSKISAAAEASPPMTAVAVSLGFQPSSNPSNKKYIVLLIVNKVSFTACWSFSTEYSLAITLGSSSEQLQCSKHFLIISVVFLNKLKFKVSLFDSKHSFRNS